MMELEIHCAKDRMFQSFTVYLQLVWYESMSPTICSVQNSMFLAKYNTALTSPVACANPTRNEACTYLKHLIGQMHWN